MHRSHVVPPVAAIGLLLLGAGVAAYGAHRPGYDLGDLRTEELLLLGASVVQAGIAAALWLRLPGASIAALLVLVGQAALLLIVLALFGVVHVLFALVIQPGGPFPGTSLNPLLLAALLALGAGAALVYAPAVRSLLPPGWLSRVPVI